eukprot:3248681-Amphidinium_carterae.1
MHSTCASSSFGETFVTMALALTRPSKFSEADRSWPPLLTLTRCLQMRLDLRLSVHLLPSMLAPNNPTFSHYSPMR